MNSPHCDLDVRPILREGGEPFSAIMEAVAALAPGQSLRLLASFKPIPLFQVLGARGFEPSAREIGNGDWEVIFTPADAVPPAPEQTERSSRSASGGDWPEPVMELDNRDLEPPEPMVKALEGVESLVGGQTIAVLLPREPVFLFEELQARGHRWRGAFEPEGHYRIVIRSGGPGGRRS
ncbi:DUF2249 domain-containing protein [Mesorhizobium sp. B1-1-7]|uniref:DUF2249 domain-containing protein n=1 Tax=Mesorhizobium sp. B1-1-7 TaxID=2589977 RepID=UPI00112652B5|nr:DUF2249 domain-containing protein [Mesorhizobium sp. B1-1-7]TPN51485.1 DUF2249 domain-containing protein [Mesorhizobium sp. B1-1-7]